MNSSSTKSHIDRSIQGIGLDHFVRNFIPFVGLLRYISLPFICKKEPTSSFVPVSNRNRGFSLIELVVTMVVAALVAAIAIPNITGLIKSGRINTQINNLKADFNYARSEAIKHRKNVVVCQSSDGASCAGTTGDWSNGRMIFVDADKNGAVNLPGDSILRFREAAGGDDRSLNVTNGLLTPIALVTFIPNGGTLPTGGASSVAEFTICDGEGPTKGRRLSLGFTGLTTALPAAPSAC